MHKLNIQTQKREELIDITKEIQDLVPKDFSGIITIQSLHTTCALTINENADPDVKTDIKKALEIFNLPNYNHSEGNSDSHVKTSFMGPSLTVIIDNGKLQLGTWQSIFLTEFDGPRTRNVIFKLISE